MDLHAIYQDTFAFDGDIYLTKYIDYIKLLLPKYHDNIIINHEEFIRLLTHIAEYYHLTEKLSSEKTVEFENTIKEELAFQE